jgi:allantoinase
VKLGSSTRLQCGKSEVTRTLIRGGTVVTEDGSFPASVLIRGETIEAVLPATDEPIVDAVIDATGKLVMPGGVDIHCHFREPDPDDREGFDTGSAGALAGGITTVVEMPQAVPPVTDHVAFAAKRDRAEHLSHVDFAFWAGITPDNLAELSLLRDAGAAAFKAYMVGGSPFLPRVDDGHLLEAMRIVSAWDGLIGVHAENHEVVTYLTQKLRDQGRVDPVAFTEARPIMAEVEAIRRAGYFASQVGCRLHVLHASCSDSVSAVLDLRKTGGQVSVETCPHYLLLSEDDLRRLGPIAKGSPPVRAVHEVDALWDAVRWGYVDILASDHSPTNIAEKERGENDIFEAPSGLIGNETMLPLVLDEALNRRGVDATTIAQLSSTNPAKRLGIYPRKGAIRPGSDADITIYDRTATWRIDKAQLHGRQRWTPYHGRSVQVAVDTVYLRGTKVFQNGDVLIKPGFGQFLQPQHR